jgi:dynein heavy chain
MWAAEAWTPPKKIAFSQLLIPTADSTRAEYIVQKIAGLPVMRSEKRNEPSHNNALLVGGPGTAKTSIILMYCGKFDSNEMLFHRMNFSSATSPYNF